MTAKKKTKRQQEIDAALQPLIQFAKALGLTAHIVYGKDNTHTIELRDPSQCSQSKSK